MTWRWLFLLVPLALLLLWAWRTRLKPEPPMVTPTWLKDHRYSRQGDRP